MEANKSKAKIIIVPKQTKLDNYNENLEQMRTVVVVAAVVAVVSAGPTVIPPLKMPVMVAVAVHVVMNVVAINMK